MVFRVKQFLTTDLWRIRAKELTRSRFFLIRVLRIGVLSFRGLLENGLHLRATALTYFSLLSVVPVAAMLFGIAKGFGYQKALEKQLLERMEGQEEVAARIISFAQAMLENVRGGLVAGVGLVFLFWAVIRLLGNIESAFNTIWGVRQSRSWGRKITEYLSLMLIGPVLFIISSTATVVIQSQVEELIHRISLLGPLGPAIFFLLRLMPYISLWVLFTFMYIYMPNTKVKFSSGLLGAMIAGTIYHVFQSVYIHAQIGLSQHNAVYGSFAALPFFLMWLQVSWLIVLFGAEISFARQNVDTYEFEPDCLLVSQAFKNLLSLRIVQLLVKQFSEGEALWSASRIAHELEAPIRLIRQVLDELVESGILSRIKTDNDREEVFQPAVHPDRITVAYVLQGLVQKGSDNIPIAGGQAMEKLSETLRNFEREMDSSPHNLPLKDM
jgi:membrane protein